MRRQALVSIAVVLAGGAGSALGQGGELAGVTMRVLDDLGGVDAVVLALDAGGNGEEAAESEGRDAASAVDSDPAAERRDLRRERDGLHDSDVDERSEGRLEDRDVERRIDLPPESPRNAAP